MDIIELADKSGDSVLREYEFREGTLRVRLEVPELDQEVLITVPTDGVLATVPESDSIALRTCYLNLMDASAHLRATEHGILGPAMQFSHLLQEVQAGLHLAYGSRRTDALYIIRLMSSKPLLVCRCKNLARIGIDLSR